MTDSLEIAQVRETSDRRMARSAQVYRPLILAAIGIVLFFGVGTLVISWKSGVWTWPTIASGETVLQMSLFLAVVAFGQGLVMLTGGLDLSVPGMIALSASIVAVYVSFMEGNQAIAIVVALVVCLIFGLINGLLVATLKAPAFIVTLAMSGVLEGLSLLITYGRKAPESPADLITLFSNSGKILNTNIGIPALLFFVVGIVGFLIQARSRFGRNVYLLGSSLESARIAGRPVNFLQVAIYGVSGLGAGIAGLMLLGLSGNAQLSLGTEWLMPSIAAVLVGGTMIGSGRGYWQNTFAAGFLLMAVTIVILATGLPQGWKQVLYGVIVLIALLATRPDRALRSRRRK